MSEQEQELVFLRSNRVVLRPVMEEDLPSIVRWVNDPEVTQFLHMHTPMMVAEEREWFENLPKRKPSELILAVVVDGKAIGTMGLHGISPRDRRATTGALIGEKEYWGKGYGTEAKMLLLHLAFNMLNIRKICSEVFVFNGRSHSYLLKCGYKEEGRRVEDYFHNGRYWDILLMAVFRDNWLPLWEKFEEEHGLVSLLG